MRFVPFVQEPSALPRSVGATVGIVFVKICKLGITLGLAKIGVSDV